MGNAGGGSDLRLAIERADLPAMILERFGPETLARPGRKGSVRAVWRGDRNPSASVFFSERWGMWRLHDHSTGEDVNAFGFLVDMVGLSRAEAARELLERAGLGTRWRGSPRPVGSTPTVPPEDSVVLPDLPPGLLDAFGPGREPGEAVWPARRPFANPDGEELMGQLADWIAAGIRARDDAFRQARAASRRERRARGNGRRRARRGRR